MTTRSGNHDPSNAADQLRVDGFVVADLFSDAELARAAAWSATVPVPTERRFVASHAHLAPPERRDVDRAVAKMLAPLLSRLVPGWRAIASSLLWKPAVHGSSLPLHQDLTFTDERIDRSYVAWIPLVDLIADGGRLTVVPGSHRWTDGIRPGGGQRIPTQQLHHELTDVSQPVPVRAGQVILFDAALIHGSEPNTSEWDRPVLASSLVPTAARLTYFHRNGSGETVGYEIDDEFFFGPAPFVDRPIGYREIAPWTADVTTDDIRRALEAHVD